jgi:hypothetical protein
MPIDDSHTEYWQGLDYKCSLFEPRLEHYNDSVEEILEGQEDFAIPFMIAPEFLEYAQDIKTLVAELRRQRREVRERREYWSHACAAGELDGRAGKDKTGACMNRI